MARAVSPGNVNLQKRLNRCTQIGEEPKPEARDTLGTLETTLSYAENVRLIETAKQDLPRRFAHAAHQTA